MYIAPGGFQPDRTKTGRCRPGGRKTIFLGARLNPTGMARDRSKSRKHRPSSNGLSR